MMWSEVAFRQGVVAGSISTVLGACLISLLFVAVAKWRGW